MTSAVNTSVRFFMYDDPALDHGWFRSCESFLAVRASSNNDNLAEVGLRRSLLHSPLRVHSPELAQLFYVPVFEFASFLIGECANTTHASRMTKAHAALVASPYFRRHQGADHFFASSAWSYGVSNMAHRMQRLAGALKNSIVGRYKGGSLPWPSRVGACVVAVPWEANPYALQAYRPPHSRNAHVDTKLTNGTRRTTLVHFAGALDVCCTGQHIRCAMGPLAAAAVGEPDVIMRYLVPPNPNRSQWKPCTRRAVELAEKRRAELGQALAPPPPPPSRPGTPHEQGAPTLNLPLGRVRDWRFVGASVFERTAREMASSVFCLMPAGDNGIRSLMYSAIAAGCLPVILCDPLSARHLPFADSVPWERFWVKLSARDAIRDPPSVLRALRAINGSEVRRRQRVMAQHRADVVYAHRESRAGDNLVAEARTPREPWCCTMLPSAPHPCSCVLVCGVPHTQPTHTAHASKGVTN